MENRKSLLSEVFNGYADISALVVNICKWAFTKINSPKLMGVIPPEEIKAVIEKKDTPFLRELRAKKSAMIDDVYNKNPHFQKYKPENAEYRNPAIFNSPGID